MWAERAGGNGQAMTYGVTTDESGNAYLTGYFRNDTMYLGNNLSDTLINSTATDPTQETFLVAKYNSSGGLVWAKCAQGNSFDQGTAIAADTNGNIFVAGSFSPSGTFTFDSVELPPSNADHGPVFIFTLDTAGNLLCDATLGCSGNTLGLCPDNKGNAFLTNFYNQHNLVIGSDTLELIGSDNAFLAKFSCSSTPMGINTIAADNATLLLYPNPFINQANVQYVLPAGVKNASLTIYDLFGRQQSSYPLNGTSGEISINGSTLSSGVYMYTLVVDGAVLLTKRMVVK